MVFKRNVTASNGIRSSFAIYLLFLDTCAVIRYCTLIKYLPTGITTCHNFLVVRYITHNTEYTNQQKDLCSIWLKSKCSSVHWKITKTPVELKLGLNDLIDFISFLFFTFPPMPTDVAFVESLFLRAHVHVLMY